MEATLKIHTTELSQEVFEKIQQFIRVNGESEVIINVRPKKKKGFPKESREDYFARIDRALDNLDQQRNVVEFSLKEFEALSDPAK